MAAVAAAGQSSLSPGRAGGVAAGAGVGVGVGVGVEESSKPYKGENTIVMMEWEKPYMRALVDNLGVTGTHLVRKKDLFGFLQMHQGRKRLLIDTLLCFCV